MLVLVLTTLLTILATPSSALDNVKTIKATHTYVMGDHDSKDDARQRCLLEAKRKILEQAGVYIESTSQVKNLDLTKDTITSYAAAVMQVKDIKERVGFQQEHMTLTLTITAQVDLAEVRKQLAANQTNAGMRDIPNRQIERLKSLEAQLEEMQKQKHMLSVPGWFVFRWKLPSPEGPSNISNADIEVLIAQSEQGDARAQNSLGWLYEIGRGVEYDPEKGKQWFEKSAAAGNAMAQVQLYGYGLPLPEDRRHEGLPWLIKAAEQGNDIAQVWLGANYFMGDGVPKDQLQARQWYLKAATQGNWYAQKELGFHYGSGVGIPEDQVRAYMWFSLAAVNSMASENEKNHAKKRRDSTGRFMSPAQVAEAQRMECEVQKFKGC